jgi:hypothetical protein
VCKQIPCVPGGKGFQDILSYSNWLEQKKDDVNKTEITNRLMATRLMATRLMATVVAERRKLTFVFFFVGLTFFGRKSDFGSLLLTFSSFFFLLSSFK